MLREQSYIENRKLDQKILEKHKHWITIELFQLPDFMASKEFNSKRCAIQLIIHITGMLIAFCYFLFLLMKQIQKSKSSTKNYFPMCFSSNLNMKFLFVYCLWDSAAEWSQNTMIQVRKEITKWWIRNKRVNRLVRILS